MDDFFTARVNGYDEHMKSNIEGAATETTSADY